MKIRPVGAEFFHADEQTDRHDKADKSLFEILRKRLKSGVAQGYSRAACLFIM